MCIRDSFPIVKRKDIARHGEYRTKRVILEMYDDMAVAIPVSYTHLRAHETVLDLVCRLLLAKKQQHYS